MKVCCQAAVIPCNGLSRSSPSLNAGPVTLSGTLDGLFIELNLSFLTCIVGIITFQIHNPFVAILKSKGLQKNRFFW